MLAYFYLAFTLLNDYEESFKHESASTEIFNVIWLKKIVTALLGGWAAQRETVMA